jgi:hypothetical protein
VYLSNILAPPRSIVSSLLFYNLIGDILTLQNMNTLCTEVILAGSTVVDIPCVVDPLDFRCPHCNKSAHLITIPLLYKLHTVATTRGSTVLPNNPGLASLKSTKSLRSGDLDIGPLSRQQIVVTITRVDDKGIRSILCSQRIGE